MYLQIDKAEDYAKKSSYLPKSKVLDDIYS